MRLGENRASAEPPRQWHSLPVLVVDDNATNRLILDAMLRKWQMLPTLVASAQEALETVAASHAQGREFGLVISDVGMPEMDGFAFCERLRQQPQTADLAIILLTSYDRMGETSHDAQLGVAAHLVKPIKESERLRALKCAMTNSSAPTSCPATPVTPTAPVTAPTAASPVPCLKVLVVDDGVTNQTLAAGILKKWGHKVHVANNGREAVEAFEAGHFDLILMDIQMPEMDGLEATTVIRRREESTGRHVHIVALTAHALKGDEQMCLAAGMDHFLSKPLRQTQLLDVVSGISARLRDNRPVDVKTS